MKVYRSKYIVTPTGVVDGFIVVENGKITDISDKVDFEEVIDFSEKYIMPGIFDTHNHGTFGYSLMGDVENPEEQIEGYLRSLLSQGVTSVFPTADQSIFNKLAKYARNPIKGAQILGIHSEGPWLNRVGEKGIRTGWPEVSIAAAKEMIDDADGYLRLVALAPEIPGIKDVYKFFLENGVTVAMAHSDQNYQVAMNSYNEGISVATHTGNVMTGLHHRDIGGLGASLLHPEVDCEIICDGLHISLEMLSIYFKLKQFDKFMMISDNTPLSGAPVGTYTMFEDMKVNITEEGFALSDTGRLMGSTVPVIGGIKNLAEVLQISIVDICKMASTNPARKYGFSEKGSLDIGKDADFIVVSKEFSVLETYILGEKLFDKSSTNVNFNYSFLEMKS